jgi:hypothetical protein
MNGLDRAREWYLLSEPKKVLHSGALLVVSVAITMFIAPPLAAQDPIHRPSIPSDGSKSFIQRSTFNLKTNARGHLQRLLQTAFADEFRVGVDVIWEPRDGWVSADVLEWWEFVVDGRDLTPQAAEPLFSVVAHESRVFSDPSEREICAVVGPSRNLLGSGYGRLIDAHDVVIRMNRAPRDGFEIDVGFKTTHHVAWPTPRLEHEADRGAFLLVTPVALQTDGLFDRILAMIESDPGWDSRRVRIINPEFVHYVHTEWLDLAGALPSTGFLALMVAAHVCDEINVFGFGADAEGRWDRYYSDERAEQTHLHAADTEADLRRQMEEKGIFKVYLGNRSRDGVEFSGFQIDEQDEE